MLTTSPKTLRTFWNVIVTFEVMSRTESDYTISVVDSPSHSLETEVDVEHLRGRTRIIVTLPLFLLMDL